MPDIERQVKVSNRTFYDTVGAAYERLDGRRSSRLARYVTGRLSAIACAGDSMAMLDLGCGSGFISRLGNSLFSQVFAVDISPAILSSINQAYPYRVAADTDFLPFRDNSFSCVCAFAMLHHCFGFDKILAEAYRVLKRGGIFYSDHDMDQTFFLRYRLLLEAYRRIKCPAAKFRTCFPELSDTIYRQAEYHETGIPSTTIVSMLHQSGFSNAEVSYHWYGLSFPTDLLFGTIVLPRGLAPLVRIQATK